MPAPRPAYLEFFAGGGMARLGLGEGWDCVFANDRDAGKAAAYRANFRDADAHLRQADVWDLSPCDIPGRADLAWASSPCQDLSLAGKRAGLDGARSSAFWGFWRLMQALDAQGRAPPVIVIENVAGLATSNGGADLTGLCAALAEAGYAFGALEIDAALFLPQSRPRLFLVASRRENRALCAPAPVAPFHSPRIRAAYARLPDPLKSGWRWWSLPEPPRRNAALAQVLEPDAAVAWHHAATTERWLDLLAPLHRRRLAEATAGGERCVGTLFRRMRPSPGGGTVQRAELRLDGVAGCLRTPAGGSSRQVVLVCEGECARTRPLSPREAARLMGLPDAYALPARATAALQLCGDGVAVPVVAHLERHLLRALLAPGRLDAGARARPSGVVEADADAGGASAVGRHLVAEPALP